jgi:GntR family transcriptional regulator of vanillate catabolism
MVRDFSEADIRDAIELRGSLEGLAARLAAERGVAASVLAEVRDCLARIDEVLAAPKLSEASFSHYVAQNARFHTLLGEMSGSALLQRQIDRVATLPFASPNAFVMAHRSGPRARDRLVIAHDQHHAVVEAIVRREGARAQGVMQEHARNAHQNLAAVLLSHRALQRLPGASLIRRGQPR